MISNHYIKYEALEPLNLTDRQKLVWSILQIDSLMDLELVYQEVQLFFMDMQQAIPEYKEIKEALYELKEMKLVSEITDRDINIILIKQRIKESEEPKCISYSNWGLG